MKARPLVKCQACGHFGHRPGSKCPLANLVPTPAQDQRDSRDVAKVFGDNPKLVEILQGVRVAWSKTPKKVVEAKSKPNAEIEVEAPVIADTMMLAARLSLRWGVRLRA